MITHLKIKVLYAVCSVVVSAVKAKVLPTLLWMHVLQIDCRKLSCYYSKLMLSCCRSMLRIFLHACLNLFHLSHSVWVSVGVRRASAPFSSYPNLSCQYGAPCLAQHELWQWTLYWSPVSFDLAVFGRPFPTWKHVVFLQRKTVQFLMCTFL